MSFEAPQEIVLTYLPLVISRAALILSIVAIRQKVKDRRAKHAEAARDAALTFIRKVCQGTEIQDSDLFQFLGTTLDLKIYFGR